VITDSKKAGRVNLPVFLSAVAVIYPSASFALTEYRDTLDIAVAANTPFIPYDTDLLGLFVADTFAYDDNLFRLSRHSAGVAQLVGPHASYQDHIDTVSVGLDDQWTVGRQAITADLRADDNRYVRNTNLDNVSGSDKLVWNWALAGQLTGEVGADYRTGQASFEDTTVYGKNVVTQTDYFGSVRYQVDPKWTAFAGVLDGRTSLGAAASKDNDSNRKSADAGVEYATGPDNSIGIDYRYTDANFPNRPLLAGEFVDATYVEDRLRFLFRYAVSDKSLFVASVGYLKRLYTTAVIGDFSGEIGHGYLVWEPSEKTQIEFNAWRELQAELTSQTNYYVTNGASIAPLWKATDKISVSLGATYQTENYIGRSDIAPSQALRKDRLYFGQFSIDYRPVRTVELNSSIRHEVHDSNQLVPNFTDTIFALALSLHF
jgi:exopolysaccharide biosynthesis operon protein EpsL